MAKPTQGRGDDSSDDEDDNNPETVAEMNRIMGRDKPAKQTSAAGMSLAERAQARMKAAARKPAPASSDIVSSLTTYVPHKIETRHPPTNTSHTPTSTSPIFHHPQHHHSSSSSSSSTSGGHHSNPSISTNKIETLPYEPQFSSPMMRNMPPPVSHGHSHHDLSSDPHTKQKTVSKPSHTQTDKEKSTSPPSPSLAEHQRTLTVSHSIASTKPQGDDIELDPPEIEDEEVEETKTKKKKKKGFWGKVKKVVVKKGKDSDSDSGEEDEKEAKEMQADIDRIMRGKVQKSGGTVASGQSKPLSLQERAALAQKRAAGK